VKDFFDRLASPDTLTQFLIIRLRRGGGPRGAPVRARRPVPLHAGRHGSVLARVLRGLVVCAVPLTGLVVLLVAEALLGAGKSEPALIDIALQLGVALLGVRALVYLLALALGPRSWIGRWESRLALLLWVLLAFALLGWFDFIESSLDAIDLVPGKAKFTIWSMLKGLVVVTLFLVVASLVSRALESRVMKIEGIALSTRIGISKFTQFFLLGLGVLLGINAAGVDLTALTVLTGAMGIGLGFGLQAIASNFVSGFVLLMDKSIKPGDVISFTGWRAPAPRISAGCMSCAAATWWYATATAWIRWCPTSSSSPIR
jgi:small-conductance mechanosensitive channel